MAKSAPGTVRKHGLASRLARNSLRFEGELHSGQRYDRPIGTFAPIENGIFRRVIIISGASADFAESVLCIKRPGRDIRFPHFQQQDRAGALLPFADQRFHEFSADAAMPARFDNGNIFDLPFVRNYVRA